jgi:hypothetical protein
VAARLQAQCRRGHPAGRGQGTGGTAAPGPGRAVELATAACQRDQAPSHCQWQAGPVAALPVTRSPPGGEPQAARPGRTQPGSESAALTSATLSAGESLPAARGGRPQARPARVPGTPEAGPGRGDSAATRKKRGMADQGECYGTGSGSKGPGPGPAAVVQLHKLETRGTCFSPFPSVELPITLS